MQQFREILAQAIDELARYGYDSPERLQLWIRRLRGAAIGAVPNDEELARQIKSSLEMRLKQATSNTSLRKKHPDVPRYTINQIKPQFRSELTRRIQASADLIKLNRVQAIEKTLQRFAGWASSVPAGGSRVVSRRDAKGDISKPLKQLTYQERRVNIDQGHKLIAAVDAVIARQTGAIAVIWHSRWRAPGYDFREDHKERDGKVYAIRGSWADEKGFINKGAGYSDEMTQPAEEPFCSCGFQSIHSLRALPDGMLTAKGRAELERISIRK